MKLTIETETDIDGWEYWGVSVNGQRPSVWFLTRSKAVGLMNLMAVHA